MALTVLSILRVAFHLFAQHSAKGTKTHEVKVYHLSAVLEASKGHLCDSVLFVRRLLRRKERSVGSQREMDTREAVKDNLIN